jgi:hypothetical protein
MNAPPQRANRKSSHEGDWEVIDDTDLQSLASQSPPTRKLQQQHHHHQLPITTPTSINNSSHPIIITNSPNISSNNNKLPMQLSPEVMRELAPAVLEILSSMEGGGGDESSSTAPPSPSATHADGGSNSSNHHMRIMMDELKQQYEQTSDIVLLQARVEELMLELQRSQMRVDRYVAASERSDSAFQFAWAFGLALALVYKRMCFSSTVGVVGAVVFGCVLAWSKEAARLRDALKAEMDDATLRVLFQKEKDVDDTKEFISE